MINLNASQNEFRSIKDVILDFRSGKLNMDDKIAAIKKYATTVIYNNDYQISLNENNFILITLNDIIQSLNLQDEVDKSLSYIRHFFLLFHNLLVANSKAQISCFDYLFLNKDNFCNLKKVTGFILKEKKIRKFLLAIIYNLILNNEVNLKRLDEETVEYIIDIIASHEYSGYINGDKDLNEINDWLHILLKNFLKSEIKFNLLDKDGVISISISICEYLITFKDNKIRNLFMELFRDYIDYAKDTNSLLISEGNLLLFNSKFIENIQSISAYIHKSSDQLPEIYKEMLMSNDESISYTFRDFICLVDILSVFLVHEDDSTYRKIIQKEITESNVGIINTLHSLLETTDKFYESVFKRNKLLTKEDAKNTPSLEERNIFHGFQTNIMKFLSNYAFKNEDLKAKLYNEQKVFYYFLNHMKLDKCNPFKKEWTVLFIKSLTEGNYRIQSLIEQLKPQEMDPLIKDYIINKGNVKLGNKEVAMDYLKGKSDSKDGEEDDDE